MCGVIGICGAEAAVLDLYQGLVAMQHRGQDSAGMVTYDGVFHLKKGNGLVSAVFTEKNMARLGGSAGLGHVRYPTIGPGSDEDAQPFFVNAPFGIAMAHNGNVTNYAELRRSLADSSFRQLNSYSDVEAILNVFADDLARMDVRHFSPELVFSACKGVFDRVEGSYSCVGLIAGKGLIAFRDPRGIKPLVLGQRDRAWGVASESVAFDLLGYTLVRDVRPGEVVFVDEVQQIYTCQLTNEPFRPCIFEWVYFARPDSIIDGIGVYEARLRLGVGLARACQGVGVKPDVVVAVPETGRAAGAALARELGVEMLEGLIKNRYIARTFIMSQAEGRRLSVQQKLNPVRSVVAGRRVLLVDDSIVRGTTAREIVAMVRNAGAREVYLAVTAPPLRYPCVYGIDMMTRGEFIARGYSVEEITKAIGADAVIYQDLAVLTEAVRGNDAERAGMQFCTACFSGEYPTHIAPALLERLENERLQWKRRSSGDEGRDR